MNDETRRRYESHLGMEPETAASLRLTIEKYLEHLEDAFVGDAVFNLELARAIGQGCLTLLDGDFDERPREQRQAIQAAIIYFLDAEDDDSDLHSVLGFDDDAEVFNHVATELGRYDLVVSLA